jgi:hypothetical protein
LLLLFLFGLSFYIVGQPHFGYVLFEVEEQNAANTIFSFDGQLLAVVKSFSTWTHIPSTLQFSPAVQKFLPCRDWLTRLSLALGLAIVECLDLNPQGMDLFLFFCVFFLKLSILFLRCLYFAFPALQLSLVEFFKYLFVFLKTFQLLFKLFVFL